VEHTRIEVSRLVRRDLCPPVLACAGRGASDLRVPDGRSDDPNGSGKGTARGGGESW